MFSKFKTSIPSAKLIATSLLMLSTSATYAAPVTPMVASNAWQFKVAPYLWAMSLNGTVQTGSHRAHIDESFSDLYNHMNFGAMVFLDAQKGKFGLFANGLFAVLSGSDQFHDGILSLNAKLRFGIFAAGASYDAYKYCFSSSCFGDPSSITVTPYVGARYTTNHVRLTADAFGYSFTARNNQEWTDPILGVKLNYAINKSWSLLVSGDLGGTNASSDYSYNAWGLVGYTPQNFLKFTTTYLGYRMLDQHYTTGSGKNYFNWNMKIFGPVLGVSFNF